MLQFLFRRSPRFEQAARAWIQVATAHVCQQAKADTERQLNVWVIPKLGHKRLHAITAQNLIPILHDYQQYAPSRARVLLRHLSHIFKYGQVMGWCKYNPTEGLQVVLNSYVEQGFKYIQPEKMPDLLAALETHTNQNSPEAFALRLLMYTATRRSEVVNAQLSEFDLINTVWIIPETRMKMRKSHVVPLAPPAVELLQTWLDTRQALGITGTRLFGDLPIHRPIELIRQAGYEGRMTLHGFRKVFSTHAHESGLWSVDAIEMQLAHTIQGVRGVYNKAQYMDERVELMTWYANEISRWYTTGLGFG